MTPDEFKMHLLAGEYYGREATCGVKVDYKSEASANKAAVKLTREYQKDLEGYPCFWCNGWHIGRALTEAEKIAFTDPNAVYQLFGLETIYVDQTDRLFGAQLGVKALKVHNRRNCAGEHCSIHNPSDHPLKDAPLNWRADKGIMERFCKHGVGHTDPDDIAYRRNRDGKNYVPDAHGCDGCC